MGDPGDQLAARLLEPLLPLPGLGELAGGLRSSVAERAELGRAAHLGVVAAGLAEAARALVQLPRPADDAAPTRSEASETMPATRQTQITTM